MKNLKTIELFIIIATAAIIFGCNKDVTDFGFDGQISGTVKDEAGKIVSGDAATNVIVVNVLGERDRSTIQIRVKEDGTYQNTKLFPQKYKIWISGNVTPIGFDTLRVDCKTQTVQQVDLTVKPFTWSTVEVTNVTSTSLTVNYSIFSDGIHGIKSREAYCSDVPSPTTSLGTGTLYDSKKKTLSNAAGSITYDGLTPGKKYFIRIGSLSSTGGSSWNYSEQIEVDTPK